MHYRVLRLWEHSRGERQEKYGGIYQEKRCSEREGGRDRERERDRGKGTGASEEVGKLPRTFKRAVRRG